MAHVFIGCSEPEFSFPSWKKSPGYSRVLPHEIWHKMMKKFARF